MLSDKEAWEYIERWSKGDELPYSIFPKDSQVKLYDDKWSTEVLYTDCIDNNGNRNILIVIRESEIKFKDWLVNFLFLPHYDKVTKNWYHTGYLGKVRNITQPIIDQINLRKDMDGNIIPIDKLEILGWSQGGATASILALTLSAMELPIEHMQVYTYGCPNYILGKNEVNMDSTFIYNAIISKDFITKMPPFMYRLGYAIELDKLPVEYSFKGMSPIEIHLSYGDLISCIAKQMRLIRMNRDE